MECILCLCLTTAQPALSESSLSTIILSFVSRRWLHGGGRGGYVHGGGRGGYVHGGGRGGYMGEEEVAMYMEEEEVATIPLLEGNLMLNIHIGRHTDTHAHIHGTYTHLQ